MYLEFHISFHIDIWLMFDLFVLLSLTPVEIVNIEDKFIWKMPTF